MPCFYRTVFEYLYVEKNLAPLLEGWSGHLFSPTTVTKIKSYSMISNVIQIIK
jgi:hypothetical protein